MKKSVSFIVAAIAGLAMTALAATPGMALPTLQLGIPGADYVQSGSVDVNGVTVDLTESTITFDNPFTLQVLGATSPEFVDVIFDVKLFVSFEHNDFLANSSGTVTVGGVTMGVGDAAFGVPPELVPHGVFPTDYLVFDLPDLNVGTGTDIITNTQPGQTGTDTGVILNLNVSYEDFFYLHFDATGAYEKKNGDVQTVKAPFSHDADAPPGKVPEPGTLTLFGFGLAGLGFLRRRPKKQ